MAVFMIERRYADQLEVTAESAEGINRINDEEGIRWLYSFLSADKRKTYCLYEAPSADAIVRAAQRAGLPADVIVEVTDTIEADGSMPPCTVRQAGPERPRTSPPGCGCPSRSWPGCCARGWRPCSR